MYEKKIFFIFLNNQRIPYLRKKTWLFFALRIEYRNISSLKARE